MFNSFSRLLNLSDLDTNPPYVLFAPLLRFTLTFRTQDQSNTHFTLFEFEKTSRKAQSEEKWNKLLKKGDMLKPCEYKRR